MYMNPLLVPNADTVVAERHRRDQVIVVEQSIQVTIRIPDAYRAFFMRSYYQSLMRRRRKCEQIVSLSSKLGLVLFI